MVILANTVLFILNLRYFHGSDFKKILLINVFFVKIRELKHSSRLNSILTIFFCDVMFTDSPAKSYVH